MPNVVGVQFQKAGKLEYYAPNDLKLDSEDWVVVESKRGIEIGIVKLASKCVNDEDVTLPLKDILRIATEEDIQQYNQNEEDAEQALILCKQLVKDQDLDMRLVNCEYTLDKSKVIFNFTADDRIDFRKLVKVLAQNLRTRIELRQIGVRDEAKLLGGIGPCGRLKYENDYYEEARAQLPDVGDEIHTPEGTGQVVGLNILDISMQVKIDGLEQPLEYKMEELATFN